MRRAWSLALAVAGLFVSLGWVLHRADGLTRSVRDQAGRPLADAVRVHTVDLNGLDGTLGATDGIAIRWEGYWNVPSTGLYDLALDSRGPSSWAIDGILANEVASGGGVRTVWLTAGFHRIDVRYQPERGTAGITAAAARSGGSPRRLSSGGLKPQLPRNPRLRRAGAALHRALGWLLVAAVVLAIRRTAPMVSDRWRHRFGGRTEAGRFTTRLRSGRLLAWTLLACIVAYGGLLRLDAITATYGPVTSPRWLSALQTRTFAAPEAVRPASFSWQPAPLVPHYDGPPTRYFSDPYNYLKFAREMRSFYGAHYREPVFPFATKVFLALLDGQDVAVSFASTACSLIAIWLAYMLGAAVWSRPVGLLAALGLAIDYDAVTLASAGWRDDAFVAAVLACAYLMVRCWHAAGEGARERRLGPLRVDAAYLEATALGVAAGLAILVRLFAVSFLAAGAVVLVLTMRSAWRRRLVMAGLAAATAALVAGPYFVNCWRVYGDPLYSFNVHGNVYRIAEGQEESSLGTSAYVISKARSRPFEMIDTIARGVTTYPFGNKWHGLDRWRTGLGEQASIAALAGLLILCAVPRGRLVLAVLVASLLPFSFTWKVDPTYRFTAHAYPFLLIAAAIAVIVTARCARMLLAPTRGSLWPGGTGWRTAALTGGTIAAVGLLGAWFIARALPPLMVTELLRERESATIMAGARDGAFFARGWSDVTGEGNVRLRVAVTEGELSIPLPEADDYAMTLRLDPFPRPFDETTPRLPAVDLLVNGAAIGRLPLDWTPERVGVHQVVLPRAAVRRGDNRILLRVVPPIPPGGPGDGAGPGGLADGGAFGLWYVRVAPLAAAGEPAAPPADRSGGL